MEEDLEHHHPPRQQDPPLHQPPPFIHPHTPQKPILRPRPMGMGPGPGPSPRYYPDDSKRALCACVTVLVLLSLLVFVLWLVYRPTKPQFTVVSAAVYGINATSPPLITASMQFTVIIHNPNRRVAIYFDTLSVFVSYRNQPITAPVSLPALYMEEKSTVSMSPVLGGSPVPASTEVTNGLAMDEAYGVVGVKLVMQGRLRWKTGAIRTAHYGIYVKCDLMMALKKGLSGQVPLVGAPICNTDI